MTPAPFSPAHARTHGEIIRHWRTGQRWLEVTALGPDHPTVCRVRARVMRLGDLKAKLDARIERAFGRA